MPKLASKKTCTGCMGCLDRCPKAAISIQQGKDGHRYIKLDSELCIECGLCEKVCPVVNDLEWGSENLESKFFAAWSNDDLIRRNGATSGVFGGLAKHILSKGGVAVGTKMVGLECQYCAIDSIEDLKELQGSKYTSSNPAGIYKEVQRFLKEGRTVLFCGLPCHVAACLSFIPPLLRKNLFTVDLICGGVSSPILLDIFARNTSGFRKVVTFRSKENGWHPKGFRYNFRYLDGNGKVVESQKGNRNLVTDGFACELTDRYSCYKCSFSYPQRKSDMTIGDLWGDTEFKSEHKNGVSVVISHSAKGHELLSSSDIVITPIEPRKVLVGNRRIFYGWSIKRFFPERILSGFFLNKLSYGAVKKIYASDLKTLNILWWPFAAWRIMSFKLADAVLQIRSNKKLKKLFK